MFDPLLSIIYPQPCGVCSNDVERQRYGVACGECWAETRLFDGGESLCAKCGAYLAPKPANSEVWCRRCDLQSYEKAHAAGLYEKALSATVIALKKTPHLPAEAEAAFLSAVDLANFDEAELVVPVPLSKHRLHERGFNQAEVLANIAAKQMELPIDPASLARVVHTPVHRAGMDAKARERTVRKAFAVKRKNFIAGKNILLVDDIFTTGSTASACAKVLKQNGAGKVFVLTLARAF
jgi:ComF family protein